MVNWSLDFFRQRAPGKRIVMVSSISILSGWRDEEDPKRFFEASSSPEVVAELTTPL